MDIRIVRLSFPETDEVCRYLSGSSPEFNIKPAQGAHSLGWERVHSEAGRTSAGKRQ